MKLATQMKNALAWIQGEGNTWPESVRGCNIAAAEGLEDITDEALARMDWAAGLTDAQIDYLKKGLVLLQHAAEAFRATVAEQDITRLADELEALP